MEKILTAVALAFICLMCPAQKTEKDSLKANMDLSVKPSGNCWQYAVGNWAGDKMFIPKKKRALVW